eukprot:2683174-Amphidinium_carterae.1
MSEEVILLEGRNYRTSSLDGPTKVDQTRLSSFGKRAHGVDLAMCCQATSGLNIYIRSCSHGVQSV